MEIVCRAASNSAPVNSSRGARTRALPMPTSCCASLISCTNFGTTSMRSRGRNRGKAHTPHNLSADSQDRTAPPIPSGTHSPGPQSSPPRPPDRLDDRRPRRQGCAAGRPPAPADGDHSTNIRARFLNRVQVFVLCQQLLHLLRNVIDLVGDRVVVEHAGQLGRLETAAT